MSQLKVVPRLSVSSQARRAIAEYRAEQNGRRRLSDEEIARIDDLTSIERINGEITIDNYDWRWQMNWNNIMDCKVNANLAGAVRNAMAANYRFVAFEGRVYFVNHKGMIEDTGLLSSEIH